MSELQGKTALVTGGSRGLGEFMARALVAAGARVYVSSRKAGACDALAAELSDSGACFSLPADLSAQTGVEAVANALQERESRLHILVNNAGATWGRRSKISLRLDGTR